MNLIQFIQNWAEVLATLIPLSIIVIFKPDSKQMRPVILYVLFAFILNFSATFVVQYHYLMPSWMKEEIVIHGKVYYYVNNNILYNIHSFVRVLFFGWYIISVRQYKFPMLLRVFLIAYLVFVLINFIFIETVHLLSTRLFSAESIVLLVMCLFYFFRSIQDDSQTNWLKHPSFLVCAGVGLYEVITFFVFLFFYPVHYQQNDVAFRETTMRIYLITYVVLCILLALALYRSRRAKTILAA